MDIREAKELRGARPTSLQTVNIEFSIKVFIPPAMGARKIYRESLSEIMEELLWI